MAIVPLLHVVLSVVAYWIALGLIGLAVPLERGAHARLFFPLSALGAGVLAAAGFVGLGAWPEALVLPLGLPDLPFHLRLDPLSAFFLLLLGTAAAGVSLFSAGYFERGGSGDIGLLCLQYHVFLASMVMVLLADDAYLFMVAWESMALASYFLVTTDHRVAEIRSAGLLYLVVAHLGAIAILLAFGVLQLGQWSYTFAAMRDNALTPFWAAVAFLLALIGFGAKAGFLPLHVWLPEAHPAAPSPVSALMSGVMLKTAVYGLLRVSFDLLQGYTWWWGVAALSVGLVTAFYGVAFAAVQTDMKRLLAYSSIENIGIVLAGLGLALTFHAYNMELLAALALAASLYHCLNHALFKSLLFLATGSVMHATRQRSLGKLGGLIRRMPWVAGLALVGTLAIAGLPPLNGFVSEWMLFQAFLLTPGLPNSYLNMFVPVAAAALALTVALAGYVMVKFYGIVFLGLPREESLEDAHDAGPYERAGLIWLALWCVVLGVTPVYVVQLMDPLTHGLVGGALGESVRRSGWLFLTPVAPERASYAPLLFLLVIVGVVLLTFLVVRRLYHGRVRRAPAWDCGFAGLNARMQDSAEGYGQPIKQIFEPFFRLERHHPSPFDAQPRYFSRIDDRLWYWLYLPVVRLAERVSSLFAVVQHGRIALYLIYSFATLLLLLLLIRWIGAA
ncbi:MAG TPA: hydrogenase 4 subunit B [Burkholderiales bacterium]|nr:hydrogenase 4 subunit B [Burkholderiales bacterium]